MNEFDVLMPSDGMKEIGAAIERRAKLHRLYREADPAAALNRLAPNIRAIVASNHTAKVDEALLAKLPKLEIVCSFGVGYDHIDAAAAARRGVVVTHTPGVLDAETADTGMALALMTVRRFPAAERYLRARLWTQAPFALTASLRERTMGILGLGRIGKEVATRARAFGVDVVYHGRRPQPDAPYLYYPSLLEMAKAVDILMICAPGGAETRHVVNREILEALGADGVLVNIARGSLVDEPALIEALAHKTILAAGLDVFADEPNVPEAFLTLDNVVLLPHVGSASVATRLAMANCVVANLISWIDGKGPLNPVPETPWPR